MHLTRRNFSGYVAGAAALAALPTPLAAAARALQPEADPIDKPRPGMFFRWVRPYPNTLVPVGAGGNGLLIAGDRNALIVDTKNAGYGGVVREESLSILNRDLALVVNTHHHADHTGGNPAFTSRTDVLAHENATPRIRAQTDRYKRTIRNAIRVLNQRPQQEATRALREASELVESWDERVPKAYEPTRTMTDRREVDLGNLTAVITYAEPAHTDNDLWLYFPEQNVLHTGDLHFHQLHPFIDVSAGASIRGWIDACDAMLEVCDLDTVVVPGHGEVTVMQSLQLQKDYFRRLLDSVNAAIDEGMTREEAQRSLRPFKLFAGYGLERLWPQNIAAAWDEINREREADNQDNQDNADQPG